MAAKVGPQQPWFFWVDPRDVEVGAEAGGNVAPVGLAAQRGAEAGVAFKDVVHAVHTMRGGLGRLHAHLRGVAGVERLGHGIGAERLLEAGGERRGGGHGVGGHARIAAAPPAAPAAAAPRQPTVPVVWK